MRKPIKLENGKSFTEWFHGCVQPVHIGFYQRTPTHTKGIFEPSFSKWDGTKWLGSRDTIAEAELDTNTSLYQAWEWRGVTDQEAVIKFDMPLTTGAEAVGFIRGLHSAGFLFDLRDSAAKWLPQLSTAEHADIDARVKELFALLLDPIGIACGLVRRELFCTKR